MNLNIAKCLTGRVTLFCPAKTDLGYNRMQLAVSVTDALHFRRKLSFDSKPNVIESPMLGGEAFLALYLSTSIKFLDTLVKHELRFCHFCRINLSSVFLTFKFVVRNIVWEFSWSVYILSGGAASKQSIQKKA